MVCLEVIYHRINIFLLKMIEYEQRDIVQRDILRCCNKDQIRNIGRYLYEAKYKWYNKTKNVNMYHKQQVVTGHDPENPVLIGRQP